MVQRRKFSKEFKLEAVNLVVARGVSLAQVSRDLDVGENVLGRWVREFSRTGSTSRNYTVANLAPNGQKVGFVDFNDSGGKYGVGQMVMSQQAAATAAYIDGVWKALLRRDGNRCDAFKVEGVCCCPERLKIVGLPVSFWARPSREMSLEDLYQQSIGSVVLVAGEAK